MTDDGNSVSESGLGKWTLVTYALGVLLAWVLRIVRFLTMSASSTLLVGAAGIMAGIWLAILGEWGALGLGLVLMICLVAFGVRTVLALSLRLFRRAETGKQLRRVYFGFIESFCLVGVVVLWHCAVLYVFTGLADRRSLIPILIFAYVMAVRPWVNMAAQFYAASMPSLLTRQTISSTPSWSRHPLSNTEWKEGEFARSNMFALGSVQLAYVVLALMVVFFHHVSVWAGLNLLVGFWFAAWIIYAAVWTLTGVGRKAE